MIPFPQMHIADSVVNRILNMADELSQSNQIKGEVLDAQLNLPVGNMPPDQPGTPAESATNAVLDGRSSLQGLLDQ